VISTNINIFFTSSSCIIINAEEPYRNPNGKFIKYLTVGKRKATLVNRYLDSWSLSPHSLAASLRNPQLNIHIFTHFNLTLSRTCPTSVALFPSHLLNTLGAGDCNETL